MHYLSYLYSIKPNFSKKVLSLVPSRFFQFKMPKRIIIETTNGCNLRCVACPTNLEMKGNRDVGFMSVPTFKRVIEQIRPGKVLMNFAGEPLLNPNMGAFVKILSDNNIISFISTNGMLLDKCYKDLVDNELKTMTIAIDGTTQKTYETYRKGGNLKKILNNMKLLLEYKKKKKSKYPYVDIQFIVMKQNEHEIPEIIEIAKKYGADAVTLKTFSIFKENQKFAEKFVPKNEKYSRYTIKKNKFNIKGRQIPCNWVKYTVVLWNGDITICCNDYLGKEIMGNINKTPFKDIWNSKKYFDERKKIIQRTLSICKNCNLTDTASNRILIKE